MLLIKTPTDLGALIRDRRTKLKLGQEELAKTVGVSRKWVVEVEAGKPRAAVGLILRTLRALDLALAAEDLRKTKELRPPSKSLPMINLDAHIESFKRRS